MDRTVFNAGEYTVSQKDVWKARKRIAPFVQKTPLIYSEMLSNQYETSIYLKLEQLNTSGSFKIRGAANKILSLSKTEKNRGITTFSTGNFGRSVAYVANRLGIRAVICISKRVPESKVTLLEHMGAEVVRVGYSQDDAQTYSYQLQREKGLTLIHPFDDALVIAGQGTIGLEVLDDAPGVDTMIAGLSGGGLHAGLGATLKTTSQKLRLIGVSTEKGAAMYESICAGKPMIVQEQDTLADSLLGGIGQNNRYTFEMVKQHVDEIVLVNETEIADGMKHLFHHEKMIVEGAAGAGIGALKHGKFTLGEKIVFIITGSSVDSATILNVMQ